MDPATLAYVSLAATGIGTVSQIAGQQRQAEATNSAAQYQAQVARNNQIIANQNAQSARELGAQQEQQKRYKTAAILGTQTAGQASSGLDVNKGSAVDVRSSAAELGELDALSIRASAAREARGYEIQGLNYGAQAQLDEATGRNALTAGNLESFSSVVGGAGSVADKWLRYSNAGIKMS